MLPQSYVEQEVHPEVPEGHEVMMRWREHGSANALPVVYLHALAPGTEITIYSGPDNYSGHFTSSSSVSLPNVGQSERVEVPISGNPTDLVSVVRVTSGRARVTVVSASRVQAEFRSLVQ